MECKEGLGKLIGGVDIPPTPKGNAYEIHITYHDKLIVTVSHPTIPEVKMVVELRPGSLYTTFEDLSGKPITILDWDSRIIEMVP